MTTTPNRDQPTPPGEFEIDFRTGLATTRAPEASKEDSHPQAILKFHRPSSLNYRAQHGLPVRDICIWQTKFGFSLKLFMRFC